MAVVATTPEYWRAVEAAFGVRDVLYSWAKRVGNQRDRLRRFARPTGDLAPSYPCILPVGCTRPHSVRTYKDEFFAVREDLEHPCTTFDLSREELILWEVDVRSVVREAMGLLNVQPGKLAETELFRVFHAGCYRPSGGAPQQVYITIGKKRELFKTGVMGLLATVKAPFIFMSLTDAFLDPLAVEALARHDCTYAVLEDYVAADDSGNLVLVQGLSAQAVSVTAQPQPGNSVVREGGLWKWTYANLTVRVPDIKGMESIVFLVAEPYQSWSLEEFAVAIGEASPEGLVFASPDEVVDRKALAQYRARLRQLKDLADDAKLVGDIEQIARLEDERDAIVSELGKRVDMQNRPRKTNESEKLRSRITRSIHRSIAAIADYHPALANHLKSSLRTGYTLSYSPDVETHWTV